MNLRLASVKFIFQLSFNSSASHPDNKVHGANMEPIWVLSAPDGPHFGPMNLAIRARTYMDLNLITTVPADTIAPHNTSNTTSKKGSSAYCKIRHAYFNFFLFLNVFTLYQLLLITHFPKWRKRSCKISRYFQLELFGVNFIYGLAYRIDNIL